MRKTPASTGRRLAELRRSGASGTHGDRRTKRLRTRSASKSASLKEWSA